MEVARRATLALIPWSIIRADMRGLIVVVESGGMRMGDDASRNNGTAALVEVGNEEGGDGGSEGGASADGVRGALWRGSDATSADRTVHALYLLSISASRIRKSSRSSCCAGGDGGGEGHACSSSFT